MRKRPVNSITGKPYVAKIRHMDITDPTSISTQSGYANYETAVNEISAKYRGLSQKRGGQIVVPILDVLSTYAMGAGVYPVAVNRGDVNADDELAYLNRVMEYNGLGIDRIIQGAVEAEIEGKYLVTITPAPAVEFDDGTMDLIKARWVSWTKSKYKVNEAEDDYQEYETVTRKVNNRDVEIPKSAFVYTPFYGRANDINVTTPMLANCLRDIDAISAACDDRRAINRLYASPTYFMRTETEAQARFILSFVEDKNWQPGQFMACAQGELSIVGIPDSTSSAIESEIKDALRSVSACSGVPVMFLGYPDLMSNRSTAEDISGNLISVTSKRRRIWERFYTQLFRKMLAMSNSAFGTTFDPYAIEASAPEISKAKIAEINEVWLPMYSAGAISLQSLLEKIPDVDPEEERERIAMERADAFPSFDDGMDTQDEN